MSVIPAGAAPVQTNGGLLGFGTAVELNGYSCLSHRSFNRVADQCASNPTSCRNGLSFSLWAIVRLDGSHVLFRSNSDSNIRYLISSGGDTKGHPGFSLYIVGHRLTGLVSTGNKYWLAEVDGHLPNNTWTNIGVRWQGTASPGEVPLGLELYVDQRLRARTVLSVPASVQTSSEMALRPPEIMVGCHRTKSDPVHRHMCACAFDETAVWTKAINETLYFLGGFDASSNDMTAGSLLGQLINCPRCSQDPQQFTAVVQKVMALSNTAVAPASSTETSGEATSSQPSIEITTTSATTPSPASHMSERLAEASEVAQLKSLANLLVAMTKTAKRDMTPEELPIFLDLSDIISKMLQEENLPKWRGLEFGEKENAGSAEMVNRFEDWALQSVQNVNLERPSDSVSTVKTTDVMELELQKMKVFNLRQQPVVKYPSNTRRGLNVVQFSPEIFNIPDHPECRFADISVIFAKYDTYSRVSPRRVSTIGFSTTDPNLLQADGPVVSTKLMVDGVPLTGAEASSRSNCTPSAEKLRKYPVQVMLEHYNKEPAKRKLMFHTVEDQSEVVARTCVWWNSDLSDYGGWDATGCTALESNQFYSKCVCSHFGQYAIILEKVAPKYVEVEYTWLIIVKYVCYSLSFILLIAFIVTVVCHKQLHEMFHMLRVNTAIALFMGAGSICLTNIDQVRHDRHMCVAIGALVHFFYVAASSAVFMEAIADFLSVTRGAIGGKVQAYTALTLSAPFLSLGYAIWQHLPDYGTDPTCMVSYEDQVKWIMFGPMAACSAGSIILAAIVLCNIQTPWLRKHNIAAEQMSVCRGFVSFCVYFVLCWIVGFLAYLRTVNAANGTHSLFQVLNSMVGIVFFVFCGLGSDRFRLLLAGKARLRRLLMLRVTVAEQLGEKNNALILDESLLDSPSVAKKNPEEDEPYDPFKTHRRKPISSG